MENMTALASVLGGLGVLILVRLLAAFRELRAELLAQREQLADLEQSLAETAADGDRMATELEELRANEHRLERLEARAVEPSYEEAARLVRTGASEQQLRADCDLSPGEARLVRVMWEQRKMAGVNAA